MASVQTWKKTCFLFDDFTDFKFMSSSEQDTNTGAGSKEI